jgi:hypothetical protein
LAGGRLEALVPQCAPSFLEGISAASSYAGPNATPLLHTRRM